MLVNSLKLFITFDFFKKILYTTLTRDRYGIVDLYKQVKIFKMLVNPTFVSRVFLLGNYNSRECAKN